MTPSNVTKFPSPDMGPVNYDAEQALLAAMFANNAVFDRCEEIGLKADYYADALHGRIHDAIGRLKAVGRKASPVTLKNLFDQDGALAEIGGAQYLMDIAQSVVTVVGAEDYAHIIIDLYQRRQAIALAGEFATRFKIAEAVGDAGSIIAEFESRLAGLAETTQGQSPLYTAYSAACVAVEQAGRAMRAGGLAGVTTGLRDLDTFLGGLLPGLTVLAGRPAMGKTTLAGCMALNAAKEALQKAEDGRLPRAVLFYSAEMSAQELGSKFIAPASRIPTDRQQRGEINERELDAMAEAVGDLHGLPLFIDDTGRVTPQAMASRARRIHQKQGLAAIFVDHIQLLESGSGDSRENPVQRVSKITRGLKLLSKELNVPVVALSQLSRAVEQRDDKRPQLADLRESGSIEQDADQVWFLFREGYYLEKEEPRRAAFDTDQKFSAAVLRWTADVARCANTAEVLIRKNRMGPTGIRTVYFDPGASRFTDLQRS